MDFKKNLFLIGVFFCFSFSSISNTEFATFAGGCFWCMEPPFEKLKGVKSVISGFSGGKIKNPSYKDVASGRTKHIEVVQIKYNPKKVNEISNIRNNSLRSDISK